MSVKAEMLTYAAEIVRAGSKQIKCIFEQAGGERTRQLGSGRVLRKLMAGMHSHVQQADQLSQGW